MSFVNIISAESIFEKVDSKLFEEQLSIEPLTIRIEEYNGPFAGDALNYYEDADIVIRPTLLPVTLAAEDRYSGARIKSTHFDLNYFDKPLTYLLQVLFRKLAFREGQLKGVSNIFRRRSILECSAFVKIEIFTYDICRMDRKMAFLE